MHYIKVWFENLESAIPIKILSDRHLYEMLILKKEVPSHFLQKGRCGQFRPGWRCNSDASFFPPRWPHMRREFSHLREAYKEVQLRRPGCQARNSLVSSRPHSSQLLDNYLLRRRDEMFKKLKQKINEEQSPQRNAQSPQQAQVGCCVAGS